MNSKKFKLVARAIIKHFSIPVAALAACMVCLMQPFPAWALILLGVVLAPLFGIAFFVSTIAASADYWWQTKGYTR